MLSRLFRPMALGAIAALGLATAATPVLAQSSSRSAGANQAERARENAARAAQERGSSSNTSRSNSGSRQITDQQRTRGAAEAPAVIQAAGLTCQPSEAAWIGSIGTGDAARQAYEVVCARGLGYILVSAAAGAAPTVQDCIAIDTLARREVAANPQATPTRCSLPGNADPKASLQPIITQAGRTCTVNNARAVGEGQGVMRYEVGCSEGTAYLLDRPTGASTDPVRTTSCLEASAANIECEYAPRPTLITGLQQTVASQTPACTVSDFRWMGRPTGRNSEFVELKCGGDAGYVAEIAANGSVAQWVTCGQAEGIGGGCQLTNSAVAQTQDVQLYASSARAANIDCAVDRYRRVGLDSASNREVVELTCGAGRPGVVAYFPIPGRQSQPAQAIDCLRAQARNIPCRLTPIESIYPSLAQQLQASGHPCAVSAIRVMGRLDQEDMIEVACDAAQRGYVVALPVAQPTGLGRVLRCVDARDIGGGCTLPANRAGDRPRS